MSALSWTLGAFALILVLARLKVPLALALLAGSAMLGFAFRMSPQNVLYAIADGAVHARSIGLVVITTLLLTVSGTMQAGGQMKRIVSLAKALFRRPAVTMAALPALIGLLPMPAGALFSAPMVESAAGKEKIDGCKLSAINYWFRHVWESWWPLYPGVVLGLAITGLPVSVWVPLMLPLSVCMIGAGLLIVRRAHPNMRTLARQAPAGTREALILSASSIWLILLVWGIIKGGLSIPIVRDALLSNHAGEEIDKFGPLAIGLMVSWIWTIRLNKLNAVAVRKILSNRSIYAIVALVVSVMVFQNMLEQTSVADRIGEELRRLRIPVTGVIALLPFIAGAVTGIAVGFVGISFPIVLALVPAEGPLVAYIALAYAFGHLGQMLSPLHLCYVVSNRYFKTTYAPVYRELLPSACLLGVASAAYFFLLKAIC